MLFDVFRARGPAMDMVALPDTFGSLYEEAKSSMLPPFWQCFFSLKFVKRKKVVIHPIHGRNESLEISLNETLFSLHFLPNKEKITPRMSEGYSRHQSQECSHHRRISVAALRRFRELKSPSAGRFSRIDHPKTIDFPN
jgi:hypothetical protein